ncbi:hypothetical protein [uncultured Thiothrix sp.]|uniref:hypothetical protein n=1 Tax=uncultured Thiothrix sp. TaxID=223185 RepID=UPI00260CDBF4|nr:hypothetical protein [uncultured Thiothrix sp.]HMT95009.1 hypothetical protein [Thiolinea sp.]
MNTTLTHILPYAVKFTALGAFIFAVLKVYLVADTYGVLVAILFAGMHFPLCLFSCFVVPWFYDHHQAMGFLALVSTLFNALLI